MSPHRVVIAGGGVAALEAAIALGTLGGEGLDIVVACPTEEFGFRAHQVREPFGGPPPLMLPLAEILAGVGRHVHGSITEVEGPAHLARTDDGAALPFDSLLLCVGG